MSIRLIPRQEWARFLNGFSREHEGWRVRTTVRGDGEEEEVVAEDAPLAGVTLDRPEETDEAPARVLLGISRERHLDHLVGPLASIEFETGEGGRHVGLRLRDKEGRTTEIRFRVPALPETLDGF